MNDSWIPDHEQTDPRPSEGSPRPNETSAESLMAADLSLIDALLTSLSVTAGVEREHRVRRVLAALDEPSRHTWRGFGPVRWATPARWVTALAVAAAFLVAISIFWAQVSRHSLADDVLSAVNKACSTPIDRIYTIRRAVPGLDGSRLPRGRLYLRGREGLVITWGNVVLGRRGDQFWLVVDGKQVTLSDSFYWIDASSAGDQVGIGILQELSFESQYVPLMQLAAVAEMMQHDYDVSLSQAVLDGDTMDFLVGRRRAVAEAETANLPREIRLWAEVPSYMIRRAELVWAAENAIVLESVPAETVTVDWYDYPAHCDSAPVVRWIDASADDS
jgi:hypothetical protein